MNIEGILRELDIDYYLNFDEAIASCPSHNDVHPSWSCNINSGVHHCFSCGFKGNLASLVQFKMSCSYQEAVQWTYQRIGLSKAHDWLEAKVARPREGEIEINDSFLYAFTEPPDTALESRNITRQAASVYGVLWNPVRDSWIFPIRDENNKLLGWQEKNERTFRNYPGGIRKSRSLFGLSALEYDSTAILVESPVDTVRLLSAGIRGGLASYGVHVSSDQLSLVHDRARAVILALDNDIAGVGETARILRDDKQPFIYVFNYGSALGKDPGELSDEELKYGTENAINRVYYRRLSGMQ